MTYTAAVQGRIVKKGGGEEEKGVFWNKINIVRFPIKSINPKVVHIISSRCVEGYGTPLSKRIYVRFLQILQKRM